MSWVESCPPKRCVEVLTPQNGISLGNKVFAEVIRQKEVLGWAFIHHDKCPSTKWESGQRSHRGKPHEDAKGRNRHEEGLK